MEKKRGEKHMDSDRTVHRVFQKDAQIDICPGFGHKCQLSFENYHFKNPDDSIENIIWNYLKIVSGRKFSF